MRNFDFEFANKEEPWRIITFWFAYQKDLMMHLKPRKHLSEQQSREVHQDT